MFHGLPGVVRRKRSWCPTMALPSPDLVQLPQVRSSPGGKSGAIELGASENVVHVRTVARGPGVHPLTLFVERTWEPSILCRTSSTSSSNSDPSPVLLASYQEAASWSSTRASGASRSPLIHDRRCLRSSSEPRSRRLRAGLQGLRAHVFRFRRSIRRCPATSSSCRLPTC